METKEHYCENCGEHHEYEAMTGLPVRSLTPDEVDSLDAREQFDSVTGLDYHECHAHPQHAVATEQLILEVDGEYVGLQHVSDVGWLQYARRDPPAEEDHETSIEKTLDAMREYAEEKHQQRHHS